MSVTNTEAVAAYRTKNRDKINERQRASYSTPEGRERRMAASNRYIVQPWARISSLVRRALRRAVLRGLGVDSNLSSVLLDRPISRCACCGCFLDYSVGKGQRRDSPSLDRLDNTKGYTADNVRVTCFWCNHLKGEASLGELRTIVAYLEREGGP